MLFCFALKTLPKIPKKSAQKCIRQLWTDWRFFFDRIHKKNMRIIVQVLFSWSLEIPCPSIGFWLILVTKLRKYYVIFVYILQGKIGNTGKNVKKITQLKWPKYQKPKDKNIGWSDKKKLFKLDEKITWNLKVKMLPFDNFLLQKWEYI